MLIYKKVHPPVTSPAADNPRPTPPASQPGTPPAQETCPECGCLLCEHPVGDHCLAELASSEELLYDLADLFKVFSDTTRIKILFSLMGRELCVAQIAEATLSTQSAVSHQLRILKQAHLVKFRRDGRNICYSLADDHVFTILSQGISHVCE